MHDPAVPAPGQTVRVTARVVSPTPSPQVLLFHRLDNNTGSGTWASKPIFDDGVSGGDESTGDGVYAALGEAARTLAGLHAAGVAIFALAEDCRARGIDARLPACVSAVGYGEFVDLAVAHPRSVSWF